MEFSVSDEKIRKMSTDISRKLLSDLSIKGSEHCDIFVDEYLSSSEKYDLKYAAQRNEFFDVGTLIVSELPKALLISIVVEVSKNYIKEVYHEIGNMSKNEKIETLSNKFSDEAVKMGLTNSQAERLSEKFTEILIANPFLNP